ncbi:SH3 domain-containing protein [Leptotrichia sp. OH3620_COT-345]|uniref:L,D-transpeptidase family protein n=1 Tax=Leptotrichia sp. OH3620_COT-345 TaxID=2491048 RepID=UPI000F645365|nr:SH3 domain-containing protein [Leptotrichia sp. OH3620_COT-345]RRD38276.1 SH3 domain-containing protein [Leptotrichia sp. OH3620_COT-345]
MKLVKLKSLIIYSLLSFAVYTTVTMAESINTLSQKSWKTVEMNPDLDKDGKKDRLLIEYFEENDKIYTKFIPYVKHENDKFIKGQTIEKVFERNNFQKEFNKFSKEFVKKYPKKEKKKETALNIQSNSYSDKIVNTNSEKMTINNNNIKTDVKKEIEDKATVPEDLKEDVGKVSKEPVPDEKPDKDIEKVSDKSPIKTDKLIKGPYSYTAYYLKERPENLTFDYKYGKNSPRDMDEFIFIKTSVNIRKEPNKNSAVLKKASYAHKYKVIGKVKTNIKNGISEWYEVYFDGKLGYVLSTSAIKREFDWHDMMKKVEKTNKFVSDAISKGQKIYVLDDYVPLGGGNGSVKDKYGNRENQSERAYLSSSFKDFINLPDRSLMTIIEETDKYLKVKVDVYDNGTYYLKKSKKALLKDSKITNEITRFIYVDRHSQNEMIIEKNPDLNTWNVVTTSFITTGKDSGNSYATPYGAFLIAYSKPVMQYTGSDNKTVVGDANNAVRFSGGGYMHSIPSLFEPKETRKARKAVTARKIGTFPESHKCIRHYDDQIKFIYNWLGNSTPGNKLGHRVPTVPTVMLVK